jgi:hypothetical protein
LAALSLSRRMASLLTNIPRPVRSLVKAGAVDAVPDEVAHIDITAMCDRLCAPPAARVSASAGE